MALEPHAGPMQFDVTQRGQVNQLLSWASAETGVSEKKLNRPADDTC